MTYYDTLEEDLKRAKEILKKGKPETDPQSPTYGWVSGGTIYGADTFAAYKLLESFVEEIEKLHVVLEGIGVLALVGPNTPATMERALREILREIDQVISASAPGAQQSASSGDREGPA